MKRDGVTVAEHATVAEAARLMHDTGHAGLAVVDADGRAVGIVDDRTLVQRVKQGDPAAERELYDAHVDRVYGLAYRMTGDETLARDLTQDAFVRAFDRIDGYRGDAALSTWLHSVTTSVVLNGLRKVRRIHQREADLDDARSAAASHWSCSPVILPVSPSPRSSLDRVMK